MTSTKAIIIKDLCKEYHKKDSSHKSFWSKLKGNKGGQPFYALKDINLEINRGEVIGIIGPNGAGKSTLLKILAEVTPPTAGSVEIFGKVASILEIGIGFQPELSGYENIFLSGELYGLTKKQIHTKLDKIIEMFGFPDFVETEVKHYSSGMYMRLAFAIIINIEADIYLFDEVLSVGDAAFQEKALKEIEKLKDKNATILLVTHAPERSLSIYDKTLFIKDGKIDNFGDPYSIFLEYLNNFHKQDYVFEESILNKDKLKTKAKANCIAEDISLTHFEISNADSSKINNQLNCIDDIIIQMNINASVCIDFYILILLKDSSENKIGSFSSENISIERSQNIEKAFKIQKNTLAPANYLIDIIIAGKDSTVFVLYYNLIRIVLSDFSNPERVDITGYFKIPMKTLK